MKKSKNVPGTGMGTSRHKFYDPVTLKKLQSEELGILKDFMEVCDRHGLTYFGIAGTGIGAVRHGGFIPWDDDIDVAMPRESFERFLVAAEKELGEKYRILNAWTDSRYPLMTTRLVKRGTTFIDYAMKGARCPCGIFLDLYVLDPVADGWLQYQLQSWEAWFWSKLLILRHMSRPYLFQTGWKAGLIWLACGIAHAALKGLHVPATWLRDRCEAACRRYEQSGRGDANRPCPPRGSHAAARQQLPLCEPVHKTTRRIAFLPDTSPYWNVFDVGKLYPLRKLPFEDVELNFPQNEEELLTRQYGDYMTMPPEDKRKTHYPYRLDFCRKKTGRK